MTQEKLQIHMTDADVHSAIIRVNNEFEKDLVRSCLQDGMSLRDIRLWLDEI